MMSPVNAVRRGWRKVSGWIHWLRHGEEEVEALYGPNPNNIPNDERTTEAGIITSLGGHNQSTGS